MQLNPLVLLALAAVPFLFNTGLQVSGINNTAITTVCWSLAAVILVWAATEYVRQWNRSQIQAGGTGVQTWHFLAVGALGTWLFLTLGLITAGWAIWSGQGLSASFGAPRVVEEEGPLQWQKGLTLQGGPLQNSLKVFSLHFVGANNSQAEIHLKDANLVSGINGIKIPLDAVVKTEFVPIDQIELIPPGARFELVARFGNPDPAGPPGHVLGIENRVFLETWRQFYFNAEDNQKKYRISYTEALLAPFFPGMAGPHITKKAPTNGK